MMNGQVEYFDEQRGFGKIRPTDDGELVFVHMNDVTDPGPKSLVPGEPVQFDIQDGDRGPKACNVIRIEPRVRGIVESFADGHGFIQPPDGGRHIFVHKTDILHGFKSLVAGEEVDYSLIQGERGPKAVRVRRVDPRPPLERFAAVDDFNALLHHLANDLAQKEDWNYREVQSTRPFPVLRSYVYYTFARLQEEGKIAYATARDNRPIACFNTGLVSDRQEPIFGVFKGLTPGRPGDHEWLLDNFYKESDRPLTYFPERPDIANYFTDPADLLYDTRIELLVDVEHVIGDNKDRWPSQYAGNEYVLRNALDGALVAAKRRIRRNYKAAIPQFYRRRIQLLLPLCLLSPAKADLALVVARENEVYRGSTVLTLDMAYNNARLIARPDSEWLNP